MYVDNEINRYLILSILSNYLDQLRIYIEGHPTTKFLKRVNMSIKSLDTWKNTMNNFRGTNFTKRCSCFCS